MKRLDLLCAAVVSALILNANAATRYWDGDVSNDWGTAENWDGDTLPSNGDTVILQCKAPNKAPVYNGTGGPSSVGRLVIHACVHMTISGAQFTISGVSGTDLTIASTGSLTVTDSGGELRLNAASGTSSISGDIIFENSTKLELPQSFDLSGSGSADFDGTVTVEISDGKKLLHDLDGGFSIDGGVTTVTPLSGTAEFDNKDGVTAQSGGDLVIDPSVDLLTSAGDWTADGSGSKITFNHQNESLAGDFILSNSASFDFDQSIYTSGDFFCNSGSVVVDSLNSEIFRYLNGEAGETDVTSNCDCSGSPVCP